MSKDIHSELLAPFGDSDIEWRLQMTNFEKTDGRAVPYVTNRAIQQRLDKTVGFQNWKNEYIPWHMAGNKASQICGISIFIEERHEWVTKFDGAENSDIEPIKGGLSDSMKRAAVQWGIGRYLYLMDTVWVKIEKRSNTWVILKSEYPKLNKAHQNHVQKLFDLQQKNPDAAVRGNQTPDAASSERQMSASQPRHIQPYELPPVQNPSEQFVWVDKVASIPTVAGGNNTNLQLRDGNGNTVEAFLKGVDPSIAPGVVLINTKFSKQTNKGVIFHILDSYDIYNNAA